MEFDDLAAAIENWNNLYQQISEEKQESRSTALESNRLYTLSPNQLLSNVRAGFNDHIARTDNPHESTAEDIDTYQKSTVDLKLTSIIDKNIFPITAFKSRSYLPLEVSRTFAPTERYQPSIFPTIVQVENNGDLVAIMNLTNGAQQGYYYAYLKDLDNTEFNGNNFTVTNTKYSPNYLTINNLEISEIYCHCDNAMIGKTMTDEYFVIKTNNTLDHNKHIVSIISDLQQPSYYSAICEHNGYYYYFTLNSVRLIRVYRVEIASIVDGGTVEMQLVSGWTGDGFYGQWEGVAHITLGDTVISDDPLLKPMVLTTGTLTPTSFNFFHQTPAVVAYSDGESIRLRASNFSYFTHTPTNRSYSRGVNFSMVIDPISKTYSTDMGSNSPPVANLTETSMTLTGYIYLTTHTQSPMSNGNYSISVNKQHFLYQGFSNFSPRVTFGKRTFDVSQSVYSKKNYRFNAIKHPIDTSVLGGVISSNEFLRSDLEQHRRVFEVLGNKTKCPVTDDQVSGVGFSSTNHDSVVVRVTGQGINKQYKVMF